MADEVKVEDVEGLDLLHDPLSAFDNDLDEGHLTDEHSGSLSPPHSEPHEEIEDEPVITKTKQRRKRPPPTLRKNPDAPRRFKSSYICFFTAKQGEIKESLGGKATVKEISQGAAQLWKHMDAEERAKWDEIAAKDKERYMKEKASYTGPWQVPNKRTKKDPSAPKRPMSAFLLFSQGRRAQIRKDHPEMKNTEVSRMLGEMWRSSSEEQKKPFQDKEKALRAQYKVDMEGWKEKAGEREEARLKEKKEQMERQQQQYDYAVQVAQQQANPQQQQPRQQQQVGYYGQAAGFANYPMYTQGHPAMYQQTGYPSQYAFSQPGTYHYQMPAGKQQPVILSANGMPYLPPGQPQPSQGQMSSRIAKPQHTKSYQPQSVNAPMTAPFDTSFGSGF